MEPVLDGRSAAMEVETQRVAFADRVGLLRQIGLVEIDAEHIDAIVLDAGLQGVAVERCIVCQRGSVVLDVSRRPVMSQALVDRSAYIDRIAENMRLMDRQAEAVYAVATMDARHEEAVLTRSAERIGIRRVCAVGYPAMIPYVRCFAIRDQYRAVSGRDAVADIQMQDERTIAYVRARYGVIIDAGFREITLDRSGVLMDIEAVRVALANGVVQVGRRNETELNEQVVYTVAAVIGDQRIDYMEHRIFLRHIEFALESGVPYMVMGLVSRRTDIYRVAEIIYRVGDQMQRVGQSARNTVGVLLFGRSDRIVAAGVVAPCAAPPDRVA